MSFSREQKEQMQQGISAAFAGSLNWLDKIIQGAGYIHPEKGVQQKDLAERVTSRKVLRDWEGAGLKFNAEGRAKFYPLFDLIKFIFNRGIHGQGISEDMQKSRAMELEFKALERQAKYKAIVGEMVSADEVKREWAGHIKTVRTRLLALPRSMGATLDGSDSKEIEQVLREEIHLILKEFAGEYNTPVRRPRAKPKAKPKTRKTAGKK